MERPFAPSVRSSGTIFYCDNIIHLSDIPYFCLLFSYMSTYYIITWRDDREGFPSVKGFLQKFLHILIAESAVFHVIFYNTLTYYNLSLYITNCYIFTVYYSSSHFSSALYSFSGLSLPVSCFVFYLSAGTQKDTCFPSGKTFPVTQPEDGCPVPPSSGC